MLLSPDHTASLEHLYIQACKTKQNLPQCVGCGPTFLLGAGRLELFAQVRPAGLSELRLRGAGCSTPHRILIISNLWVLGGPPETSGTEATPPARGIDCPGRITRLMRLRSLQEMGIHPISGYLNHLIIFASCLPNMIGGCTGI